MGKGMLRNGWRMDWRRFTTRAAVRTRLDNILSVGVGRWRSRTVAKALQLGVGGGMVVVVVVVVIKRKSTIIKRKELIELVRLGGAGAIKAWWCQPDYYYLFTRLRWNAKAKGRPGKRAGGGGLEDGKV